jgi:hypothetical protein
LVKSTSYIEDLYLKDWMALTEGSVKKESGPYGSGQVWKMPVVIPTFRIAAPARKEGAGFLSPSLATTPMTQVASGHDPAPAHAC